ncbi:IS1595 family transposase [Acidicapsa dinghuensis]|uniref:IS1595 family transposase n=1 Tax=Acidicapsa dinghuensis TaxID=2218256 RepID=A0ABW1EMT6_9BACT|nr:IS1595 family transposase [Acidicapsa dinghuensis]
MNLIDVTKTFQTDDDCLAYLETMRWPDGIRCPVCGNNHISKITRKTASKNKRTRIYQCLEPTCKNQFSATSGTIFNDSHLPLTKWFMALALIVDAKKSMSAKQLQEHLGIGSYRTAWYMAHRIRKSMAPRSDDKLSGIVEMDETYVGGKGHGIGRSWHKRFENKEVVVGIKERGGRVRMFHTTDAKIETLAKFLKEHVSADVEAINTDELRAYPKALRLSGHAPEKHMTVNHSKNVYVDGNATTNGIESAFSLFKRAIIGSYHQVSIKHLHRYLSEFETRFNARKEKDRFNPTLRRMLGVEPMPYAELVAE